MVVKNKLRLQILMPLQLSRSLARCHETAREEVMGDHFLNKCYFWSKFFITNNHCAPLPDRVSKQLAISSSTYV